MVAFAVATIVILLAAPFLASSAEDIADHLGVSTGVVGVILLALTTSLPEVTVTVESIRRGAFDMAVGNLLGSNCINMVLLLPLDVVHGDGSILAHAGPAAMVAGMFAILIMSQTVLSC